MQIFLLCTFMSALLWFSGCASQSARLPEADRDAYNKDAQECLESAKDEAPPTVTNIANMSSQGGGSTPMWNTYRTPSDWTGANSQVRTKDQNAVRRLQLERDCLEKKGWLLSPAQR